MCVYVCMYVCLCEGQEGARGGGARGMGGARGQVTYSLWGMGR